MAEADQVARSVQLRLAKQSLEDLTAILIKTLADVQTVINQVIVADGFQDVDRRIAACRRALPLLAGLRTRVGGTSREERERYGSLAYNVSSSIGWFQEIVETLGWVKNPRISHLNLSR